MKVRALALSTVLLFSMGAFAQDSAPANSPSNSSSMSSTQNGTQPGDNNAGAMPNTPTGNMDNTQPYGYRHRHRRGGWGWIGLFGLLGLLGLGGRRRTYDTVVTTNTLPPR